MTLREIYVQHGAELAPDGIPLHFGNLKAEYAAALNGAILLDRSHEGRMILTGRDRFELLNRMSTNNILNLPVNSGKPTIFINPNARVIDRAEVFAQPDESLLVMAGPGRGEALRAYLQRNIFFNDQAQVEDVTSTTHQFALHGPNAGKIIEAAFPDAAELQEYESVQVEFNQARILIGRLKPLETMHWFVIVDTVNAADVWLRLMEHGHEMGSLPAGGLTFNTLRIRAGIPGIGRELTPEYIPLELGLWDEISFNKGCYTGQEIIARMESRNKLARTIVRLKLDQYIDAQTALFNEGRQIGLITSSAKAPDGAIFAIGVIKTDFAEPGITLTTEAGETVQVMELLGEQPLKTST